MQVLCARCATPFSIERPQQLLITPVCVACSAQSEVSSFIDSEAKWHSEELVRADKARARFAARKRRLAVEEQQRLARLAERSRALPVTAAALPEPIRAAALRARQRTTPAN